MAFKHKKEKFSEQIKSRKKHLGVFNNSHELCGKTTVDICYCPAFDGSVPSVRGSNGDIV